MAVYEFGSGVLYGRKVVSSGVVTPVAFGALQDVSLEFNATTKSLMGQYQFALAVGRGAAKITGKARFARVVASAYNELFFNGTLSAGLTTLYNDEAATIPATPFTVTVAHVANGGIEDLGVLDANGKPMTRVSSSPITGQYSVVESTGVYTFAAADTGLAVTISYTNTAATGGQTIAITNNLLGTSSFFGMHLKQSYGGNATYWKLNQAIGSKLTWGTKQEDFTIPEFDFECFADPSNKIGTFSTVE